MMYATKDARSVPAYVTRLTHSNHHSDCPKARLFSLAAFELHLPSVPLHAFSYSWTEARKRTLGGSSPSFDLPVQAVRFDLGRLEGCTRNKGRHEYSGGCELYVVLVARLNQSEWDHHYLASEIEMAGTQSSLFILK